jgi:hypothetical protein
LVPTLQPSLRRARLGRRIQIPRLLRAKENHDRNETMALS